MLANHVALVLLSLSLGASALRVPLRCAAFSAASGAVAQNAEALKLRVLRDIVALESASQKPQLPEAEGRGWFARRKAQRAARVQQRRTVAMMEAVLDESITALEDSSANLRYEDATADGAWNLVYTRNGKKATRSQKVAPNDGQQQIFDVANRSFDNLVTFSPKSFLNAKVAYEPVVMPGSSMVQRLDCRISKAVLQLRPWLRLRLPLRGKGWLDFVYMDADLRVTKGNRGSSFVHVKEGSELNGILASMRSTGVDAQEEQAPPKESSPPESVAAAEPVPAAEDERPDEIQADSKPAQVAGRLKSEIAKQLDELKEIRKRKGHDVQLGGVQELTPRRNGAMPPLSGATVASTAAFPTASTASAAAGASAVEKSDTIAESKKSAQTDAPSKLAASSAGTNVVDKAEAEAKERNEPETLSTGSSTSAKKDLKPVDPVEKPVEGKGATSIPPSLDKDSAKPVVEAAKPAPEAVKPVPEAKKPVVEAVKPVVEAAKPAPEAVKPVPEAAKPVVEAAKPVVEAAKPVVEAVKPAPEAMKPVVEAAKPVVEATKPVAEAMKPAPEASKPVVEAAKPVVEAVKPAPEAVKPAAEAVKPAPEAVKPAVAAQEMKAPAAPATAVDVVKAKPPAPPALKKEAAPAVPVAIEPAAGKQEVKHEGKKEAATPSIAAQEDVGVAGQGKYGWKGPSGALLDQLIDKLEEDDEPKTPEKVSG
eukprot:scaffold7340_cov266-Pinguiococcus_pyrenoidosus.AAC.78